MKSVTVFETHGNRFAGVVTAADSVSAPAPARKASLPDSTMSVLMELQGFTPADRAEWNDLVVERHALNERTLAFVVRQLAAKRVDLEQRHEEAKRLVREQKVVLDRLARQVSEDTRQWVRADNAHRLASAAARDAEVAFKNLGRFSSKAEIAAAEKRVTEANKKVEVTQAKASEWGQHLNHVNMTVVPAEKQKMTTLVEAEADLADQIAGREPGFSRFGFVEV